MCFTHISPSPQDLVLTDPLCFTHISPSGPSIKRPCVFYTHFTLTSGPSINWPHLLCTHFPPISGPDWPVIMQHLSCWLLLQRYVWRCGAVWELHLSRGLLLPQRHGARWTVPLSCGHFQQPHWWERNVCKGDGTIDRIVSWIGKGNGRQQERENFNSENFIFKAL